ncbi:MAG: hypothetical protein KDA05_08030 [Phycisphaerales bacterium]|nr:hypothetical protein [Phycisphaerales bacterium]MCB9840260.1 MFS transporter [Phycisphaeraceae bacterium]
MRSAPLAALFSLRRGEPRAVVLGGLAFFLILCSYFVLRPVREAMGVHRNFDDLYWLWIVTLLGMVGANALYATLASSVAKRLLATCTYRVFALSLATFVLVLTLAPHLTERPFATLAVFDQPVTVGHVFYVWISVFNLFAVSLFWAQAADRFGLEQAKRLFPLLGAGGTLGALAGSTITTSLAGHVEPVFLMGLSLVLWRGAIAASQWAFGSRPDASTESRANVTSVASEADARSHQSPRAADGGTRAGPLHAWRALTRVVASPYLLGISAWMFALAIASSLLYFTQARIITDTGADLRDKIFLFAQIDLLTQGATLLIQLTITARLFRLLGVGRMLLVIPALLVLGYAALAVAPIYAVLALFQAAFRASRYAIATPARESLFTVVSPEEKYVSKAALDTFVYRAGDVSGALMYALLDRLAATLAAIAAVVVPLAVAWSLVGLWLGRRQKQLATQDVDSTPLQPGSREPVPA